MLGGVLAGYEMVDIKVSLYDGSYHDVDSNEMAFKIAGSMAFFKEAPCAKAKPVLLEPVMSVEVTVPEEYMGTIIGDLNSRRGRIEGMEMVGGVQAIRATVPLSTMFGYATGDARIDAGTSELLDGSSSSTSRRRTRFRKRLSRRGAGTRTGKAVSGAQALGGSFNFEVLNFERSERQEGEGTWRRKNLITSKPHVNIGTIRHIDHGKDDVDGGDHEGFVEAQPEEHVPLV